MSAPKTAWILSDGKQGHLSPMIGVAEALGIRFEIKSVPRIRAIDLVLWPIMAHFGVHPVRAGAPPLMPPYPDLCIASGRRTIRHLRMVKEASPQTFCVYFMDPRSARAGADVVVSQHHDGLSGENVVKVRTAPHRFSAERLERARREARAELAALPRPRVAVLIGGDSRHHRFKRSDIARLSAAIDDLAGSGAGLMITLSRRTPPSLAQAIQALAGRDNVYLWDGSGENPITEFLALADQIVVTGDSISMMGEAAATGRPIHIFSPSGGHPKFDRFQRALGEVATLRPFPGALGGDPYSRVDSTRFVADAILDRRSRWLAKGRESG
ncbi:mitochondrial fission ELM1 family protein [Aquibium sp. ELW1220]|uniref:mitochondrial fission ELM1 family protein n=1 Tax=Aquibium sp. ELW1220 TaxID=2976766 RepID=UPI0025AFBE94|nr:mitochondrial fission ELM1 family protein [Aquibium sp. ELW1220]MDN2584279.1 mitochondrial fission ELM1 family protein [Aquibium sp. ELW1220]